MLTFLPESPLRYLLYSLCIHFYLDAFVAFPCVLNTKVLQKGTRYIVKIFRVAFRNRLQCITTKQHAFRKSAYFWVLLLNHLNHHLGVENIFKMDEKRIIKVLKLKLLMLCEAKLKRRRIIIMSGALQFCTTKIINAKFDSGVKFSFIRIIQVDFRDPNNSKII